MDTKEILHQYSAGSDFLLTNNFSRFILLIANLASAIFGFLGFMDQFTLTLEVHGIVGVFLLPFIPECPIFALLFLIILVKRDIIWLNMLVLSGLLKGGLGYYVIIFLELSGTGFSSGVWFEPVALLAHSAFFVEAFILFPQLEGGRRLDISVFLGWSLLANLIDFTTITLPLYPQILPSIRIYFRLIIFLLWMSIDFLVLIVFFTITLVLLQNGRPALTEVSQEGS